MSPLGKITVVKNVINNDRGTKKPSDFMIFVTGNSPSPNNFPGSASGTSVSIKPGNYEVVEASVSGYTTTYSSGCSGSITGGETIKCVVSNDDIPPIPFIDTGTVKLGKSTFLSDALRPLIDVGSSSSIIGGHVSLSSPTGNSDHLKLIVQKSQMQDTARSRCKLDKDIGHNTNSTIAISYLSKINFCRYQSFYRAQDRLTHFTDLLLWNNGTSAIQFVGNNTITMKVIFEQRSSSHQASHLPAIQRHYSRPGILKLYSSTGALLTFESGLYPIHVGSSSSIIGGHVSLSSPTGNSDHLKLIVQKSQMQEYSTQSL